MIGNKCHDISLKPFQEELYGAVTRETAERASLRWENQSGLDAWNSKSSSRFSLSAGQEELEINDNNNKTL